MLASQKRFDEAIAAFEEAPRLSRPTPTHGNLGLTYLKSRAGLRRRLSFARRRARAAFRMVCISTWGERSSHWENWKPRPAARCGRRSA